MQNNDHAVYYFNEQNGQHPSYNDENTIISDHNKRDSFTAQSDSDLYENNATQISKEEVKKKNFKCVNALNIVISLWKIGLNVRRHKVDLISVT